MKDNTGQVLVQAPASVANFLVNEKRAQLSEIESRQNVTVIVVADRKLETPHLEIQRIRSSEVGDESRPSYQRTTPVQPTPLPQMLQPGEEPEQPAVSGIVRATPAPLRPDSEVPTFKAEPTRGGLIAWLKSLFGAAATAEASSRDAKPATREPRKPAPRGNAERRSPGRAGGRTRKDSQPRTAGRREAKPEGREAAKPARERRPGTAAATGGESPRPAANRPARPRSAPRAADTTSTPVTGAPSGIAETPVAAPERLTPAADVDRSGPGIGSAETEATRTRRRGRRGGRRRRKDAAVVAPSDQSQPARDFDDEDRSSSEPTPASADPQGGSAAAPASGEAGSSAASSAATPLRGSDAPHTDRSDVPADDRGGIPARLPMTPAESEPTPSLTSTVAPMPASTGEADRATTGSADARPVSTPSPGAQPTSPEPAPATPHAPSRSVPAPDRVAAVAGMPSLLPPASQPDLLPGLERRRGTDDLRAAVAATIAMPSLQFPLSGTLPADVAAPANPPGPALAPAARVVPDTPSDRRDEAESDRSPKTSQPGPAE
jgi:ribonuclease E